MNPRFRQRKNRRGASIVEFAIIGPIALLLLLAGIDIIRLYIARNSAQTVAYEIAKLGCAPGATKEGVIEEACSRLETFRAKDARVFVEPDQLGVNAEFVTVRIEIPVASNSWLLFTLDRIIIGESNVSSQRANTFHNRTLVPAGQIDFVPNDKSLPIHK